MPKYTQRQHYWDIKDGHINRDENISRKLKQVVVLGREEGSGLEEEKLGHNREDMGEYEMTLGMTENRQYWNKMVNTGPQTCAGGR